MSELFILTDCDKEIGFIDPEFIWGCEINFRTMCLNVHMMGSGNIVTYEFENEKDLTNTFIRLSNRVQENIDKSETIHGIKKTIN